MKMSDPTHAIEPIILEAEPEPLQINLQRTAVVVIDMQNGFISKGGVFDLMGVDLSPCRKVVEVISKIISAARARGVMVIYTAHHWSLDLRECGGPNSGIWYTPTLRVHREHPEWRDKNIFRGTWGAEIIKELEPREDEIIVTKSRYTAFFGTLLDTILKTSSIKYLIFVGTATNVCVEATLRDAYNLNYFPILISDGAVPAGPPSAQEATIFNVRFCYGWVTASEIFLKALKK